MGTLLGDGYIIRQGQSNGKNRVSQTIEKSLRSHLIKNYMNRNEIILIFIHHIQFTYLINISWSEHN